jgi:Protein of unknown function (DUF1501)
MAHTMPRAATLLGQRSSRRRFLQIGASGLLGVGLADLLRAESTLPVHSPRARGMILIWLGGGPATIDMWDPKPQAASEIRGEFASIATALPGVRVSEHMPRTAEILDRALLVRSLHHNIPDHVPGTQYLMTGNKPSAALEYPSLGSIAAHVLPGCAGMPAYFALGEASGTGAGFLGAAYDPFRVASAAAAASDLNGVVLPASMTREQLDERRRFRDLFNARFLARHGAADLVPTLSKFQHDAYEILASNRIGQAFDLGGEPESIRKLYPEGALGRGALVARRLIEAGARFVTVGTNDWDTHVGNFAALRRLLPQLDQALAALVVDLDQRGMLAETLVVCGGEFGRTPLVNANAGRDHWSRAMTYFAAGGGLKPGHVHGGTDPRGFDPIEAACSPDDWSATLLAQLGFPATYPLHTTAGRPVELFKNGAPIAAVVA